MGPIVAEQCQLNEHEGHEDDIGQPPTKADARELQPVDSHAEESCVDDYLHDVVAALRVQQSVGLDNPLEFGVCVRNRPFGVGFRRIGSSGHKAVLGRTASCRDRVTTRARR